MIHLQSGRKPLMEGKKMDERESGLGPFLWMILSGVLLLACCFFLHGRFLAR